MSYQWSQNGVDISGANDEFLVLDPVTAESAGLYRATITGGCSIVSTAVVRVSASVGTEILVPPHDTVTCLGSSAELSIEVSGVEPLSYQWQHDGKDIPGATEAAFTLEADGTIQLLGRGSNCINTGGEKVFPEEVEEALKSHPHVLDAAVFGEPDPRWGQAVAAVVRIRAENSVAEPTLHDYLKAKLASYKCPKRLRCVDVSFRADNGKMDYALAKQLFER